jgi:hypothetical protein
MNIMVKCPVRLFSQQRIALHQAAIELKTTTNIKNSTL